MGFLGKLLGNDAARKDLGGGSFAQTVGMGRMGKRGNKTPEQLAADYTGFVYRAIEVKATNVAREPIYTEQLINGNWTRKEHAGFTAVLEGTPDTPSQSWLRVGITTYKQIFGEAFVYVNVLENSRKPYDRVLLYPNRVQVIADSNGKVVGYKYGTSNGQDIPLEADEVIHFKYFNPNNHLRGYSPLQAAGLYVDAERNTVQYVANFLENNATPSGIILLPAATAEEQYNQFAENWRNKFGGIGNAGKTAILQADGVDFKQISSTLKDMQLGELKTMSRDDTLAVLGVSKHMLGIAEDAGLGRATAEAHEYIFAKHVLEPELSDDASTFDEALRRYFPADAKTWRVSFEDPVPEDKEYKLKVITSGSALMTINERRQLLGLSTITGGDTLTQDDGTTLSTKTLAKIKVKQIIKQEISFEQKEAYRLSIQQRQLKYERKFKKQLKEFIDDQKEQVLNDLIGSKGAAGVSKAMTDGNLNPNAQAKAMAEISIGVLIEMLQEQGDLAIKFAGGTEKFVVTPAMRKYIRDNLDRAALDYNQNIVAHIAKAVTEGLKENESLMQIGKRISEEYKSIGGYELDRIVRTETLRGSNEATQFGYEQLGITEKEWYANPNECDYCASVAEMGKQGIGDVFVEKGETLYDREGNPQVYDYDSVTHPPLHPNCRCTLLPVRG